MPSIGRLDRRITIERYTVSLNAFNEEVQSWGVFRDLWASREDVSDGEMIRGGMLGSHQMSRFVIRSSVASRTITPKDRVVYDGDEWNIKAVKETSEGRNRFLEITAVRSAD